MLYSPEASPLEQELAIEPRLSPTRPPTSLFPRTAPAAEQFVTEPELTPMSPPTSFSSAEILPVAEELATVSPLFVPINPPTFSLPETVQVE